MSDNILEKAGNLWSYLDKLSVTKPEEYQKFINQVIQDGKENNMGPPKPKFVLQTVKIPEIIPIRKYFINITEWPQVPAPKSKEAPIPVHVSEHRKEIVDKEWASIYDVTFNPSVFPKDDNMLENAALIECALQFIENKFRVNFSRKYKILEKKYEGNQDSLLDFICPTVLKDSISQASNRTNDSILDQITKATKDHNSNDTSNQGKKSKIADNSKLKKSEANNNTKSKSSNVESQQNDAHVFDPLITGNCTQATIVEEASKTLINGAKTKKTLKRPKVEMIVDKETNAVEISIELPGVLSVQECDLNLSERNVTLSVLNKYDLDLDLPVCVLVDDSKAKFIKDQSLLLLTAPYSITKDV